MKESDKTKTYSDTNKTTIYGDSGKLNRESVHNLKVGDKIVLKDKEYLIIEIISESTGEAVIYKVENTSKNIFALKLYYEFHNPENEPNTEALTRIKNIDDVDILKLLDFGTGINKYKGRYCFEILNFAKGFDLLSVKSLKEKYSLDFIVGEVIPQVFKGILHLHKHKIYHCDLKPQNVFYLDKEQIEIVIGDYGSAKTFEFDAAKSSRKTTTVKGTDFYLPPEQARGFISGKNDYYSFGMILLHLFYPEKILLNVSEPKSLSHAKLKQIIERQFEAKSIIDFNPDYKRMNSLIEGLTLVDFNLRWGKEQVQQWIDGNELEVIYSPSYEKVADDKRKSVKPLKFSSYSISTVKELRDYILNDPDWYVKLIEDTENRKAFSDWLLGIYGGNRSKRSAFNRIVKNYSPEGIDFVADAIIRFFIPEHAVLLGLQSFNFAKSDDILETTALAFFHLIFDLWSDLTEKDVKLFIFSYEFALRQTKNRVEANRALKILYQKLSINENAENDFEDYNVFAFTKINKGSLEIINGFLIELLVNDFEIEVISLDKENNLHYNIIAILPMYLQSTGSDNKLSAKSLENKVIPLRCPDYLKSFDDFIEKIVDSFKEDLISKDNILKDINASSSEKIRETIKNIFRNIIKCIENELTNLGENFSEELKTIDGLCMNLNEIASFLQNIRYDKVQQTYEDILSLKDELKKVLETKEMIKQYYESAKEKSTVWPLLEEAKKLIETNNYKDIEKAWQILTSEHSFKIDALIDIRNIKQHQTVSYKKLGRITKIGLASYVASFVCSNDGKYIIAGSNQSIMIIDLNLKKTVKTHNKIESILNHMTISKDGKYIAYTDIFFKKAIIYEIHSGKNIRSLKYKGYTAKGVAFSPDGKYLAVSGNGTLFWNIKTGKVEKTVDALNMISFHPIEDIFVGINSMFQIVLKDILTLESTIISEENKFVGHLCISPDGKLIAGSCENKTVKIWDIRTAKLLHVLPGHKEGYYTHTCFSLDGKLLASIPKFGRVSFWSMETGKPLLTLKKFGDISGLVFHPSGEYIVIAYEDKLILIYLKNSFKGSTHNMKILDFINYETSMLNNNH
ncbi:MAG: hypothetical protein DRI95_14910 [Bacteroidetes bacterium]|nr:MAG: hypothetical protein DRI95_14910 [Bacteroidota bacterium]